MSRLFDNYLNQEHASVQEHLHHISDLSQARLQRTKFLVDTAFFQKLFLQLLKFQYRMCGNEDTHVPLPKEPCWSYTMCIDNHEASEVVPSIFDKNPHWKKMNQILVVCADNLFRQQAHMNFSCLHTTCWGNLRKVDTPFQKNNFTNLSSSL